MSAVVIAGSGLIGLASVGLSSPTPAHADPSIENSYIGVGSDTIQDVLDAYTGADPFPGEVNGDGSFSPFLPVQYPALTSGADTGYFSLTSWDAVEEDGTHNNGDTSAVNPGCIEPSVRLGGPKIDRPNGSGAGRTALADALQNIGWQNTGAVTSCTGKAISVSGEVDFARSSAGPSGTPGTSLQFVPFARGALTFIAFDHGSGETTGANSLTLNQLAQLFSDGQNGTTAGKLTLGNGHTVLACSTNLNSGTWATWIKDLNKNSAGFVDTSTTGANAAIASGCNGGVPLEEHGGDAFYNAAKNLPAGTDAVAAFDVAQWSAQHNGAGVDRSSAARAAGLVLGDPSLTANTSSVDLPYNTTGCNGAAGNWCGNTNFYANTTWGRNVYIVLPYGKVFCNSVICNQDQGLAELFTTQGATNNGPAGTTGAADGTAFTAAICTTGAEATAATFGFTSVLGSGDTCGDTLSQNSTPYSG